VRALRADGTSSDSARSLTCGAKHAIALASSGSALVVRRRRTRTALWDGEEDMTIVSFFKETTRTSEHSQQSTGDPA
jgi:hypothetical protein